MEKHVCLEITPELELRRYSRIPDQLKRELNSNKSQVPQIVHFPFLFRPVSIIIPDKGKLRLLYEISISGDTGSGTSLVQKQEVASKSIPKFKYIDIFSLMAN